MDFEVLVIHKLFKKLLINTLMVKHLLKLKTLLKFLINGVPLDLMLTQAIGESNIGTKGAAVKTKYL